MPRATVIDHENLQRDMSSNGIINTNRNEYLNRISAKQSEKSKALEFENLKSEVYQLKALVSSLLSASTSSK
jgi:hypothetical protein